MNRLSGIRYCCRVRAIKRTSHALLTALILAAILLAGCSKEQLPVSTPLVETDTGSIVAQGADGIKALGTIRPAQALELGFGASGPINSLSVRLGSVVHVGDVLAALDTTALEMDLRIAQEQVAVQQAALDALLHGPSQAEIERAATEHAQQVAQGEVALRVAELELERARLQSPAAQVALAQAEQAQLDLQVAQARAQSPQAEVTAAQIGLARAQEALATAQDEYRKALDRPWEPQTVRDGLVKAVQQAERDGLLAEARLAAAQGVLRAHALGLDLLAAQGSALEVQRSQALAAQGAFTVTLEILAARVEQARLELDGLKAWRNPLLDPAPAEEIAQAQARLRQAELAVGQLQWQIEGSQVRAPFDGIVAAVHAHPGEWSTPGMAVVEILDTTRWVVETRNVSELAIGQIQVGQGATVEVIALGGESLRGRVETISPVAVVQQGDTTYTLTIALEPTDRHLMPGMNAQVEIELE
jgi:multidrug efflux pump subunit AcrA (membrane-fusion protein)